MKQIAMARFFYRILDILIFLLLLLRFAIWAGITYLDSNYIRRMRKPSTVRMLDFTTSSSYSAYSERGLLSNLTQQEEDGYLDRYYTIYPFTPATRTMKVSDKTTLVEWGTERFSRWKNFKYSRNALILWDFFHYCVRLIKNEGINIIRSNNPFTSAAIALLCSKLTRTPYCVAIRQEFDSIATHSRLKNLPKVFGLRWLAAPVQRLVLFRADMVIPTNESRAKYAVRHGAKPERIRLDPFRIDPAKFPSQSPNLKKELEIEGKKIISFVGRLVSYNYVSHIIHIAAIVCQQRKDVVFVIVGDGEERKSLDRLTKSLGLNDSVMFLGMQPWHKAMQVRLISNVSLCLKAGNSLVEAAVAVTPLVAYDVDWHYELVRSGETGFLLPEGDINGVAEAILKLLDNPDLSRKLGENARRLALERHAVDKVRRMRISFYEELMGRAN